LYRETNGYLDRLARAAKEGKNLMEAANYCRWLAFSGIFSILDKCTLPMNTHGEELRRKNQNVIEECGRHFRGGKIDPNYQASDIAEINRKLDLLLSGGGPVSVVDAPLPMPKAIGGGL
jgi:hypothetical protein